MREQNLEEVKSLIGKIDKNAMGQNSTRDKPKPKKNSSSTKPKKNTKNEWEFKGGNILDEKFDESIYYRPKTK